MSRPSAESLKVQLVGAVEDFAWTWTWTGLVLGKKVKSEKKRLAMCMVRVCIISLRDQGLINFIIDLPIFPPAPAQRALASSLHSQSELLDQINPCKPQWQAASILLQLLRVVSSHSPLSIYVPVDISPYKTVSWNVVDLLLFFARCNNSQSPIQPPKHLHLPNATKY